MQSFKSKEYVKESFTIGLAFFSLHALFDCLFDTFMAFFGAGVPITVNANPGYKYLARISRKIMQKQTLPSKEFWEVIE
jgi:hypothetical protein